MKLKVLERIPSFQQQVEKVLTEDNRIGYKKKIISNFSWWTFDQSDLFEREIKVLNLLDKKINNIYFEILDLQEKEFFIEEIPRNHSCNKEQKIYLIIELLNVFRKIQSLGLDNVNFPFIVENLVKNGEKAKIEKKLLEEIKTIIKKWKDKYDSFNCFVHGDLDLNNIFFGDCKISGLIDFEETIISQPQFDAVNISWSISEALGKNYYDLFSQKFESAFKEKLIPLDEWKRFCLIRNWIASCYLERCCSRAAKERAKNFIFKLPPSFNF